MKKNYKIILFVVVFLIIGVASFGILNSDKKNKIDKILASESYSYLPKEAKNYIKEVYEETGEVILTEKNKEENVPYLNPKYVDYLSIDNKEKDEISLIPNAYVIDFSSGKEIKSSLLPSYYNISNVDGNNYTTPMKNQGNLDLCWAFASLEQAESYLMKSENKSYSESSKIFSTRQMDYATSINGISNYENENGSRLLTYGGNFNLSAFTMSNGLSLVNDSHMPYNYSKEQRELSDVLNYRNSNYEVNSTITMPQITDKTPNEDKENYNAVVKQNIIKYGGAYVSTASPNGKCGFKNKDNSYAMIDSDNCAGNFGHAMQIIGWDDDYEYNYCLSGSSHLSVGEDGNCESGKSISGKGAWILRNSWGDESVYKNVFLAYDSYGLDINFTTSLSDMNSRIWDNNYHNKYGINTLLNTKSSNSIFSKKINTEEKVEYIKFMSASINGEYSVSIDTQDNSYNDIKIVNTDYPGIYTVDLSEENILLTSDKFKINIQSENNTYVVNDSISVFTSNIDKTPNIYTETIDGNNLKLNNDSNYEFVVYSETKNINSGENVTYSLYKNNINYSNYILSVNNNIVSKNNINTKMILNGDIPSGNYILKISYNDYSFESSILIPSIYSLHGNGTIENPYQIYNEKDLNQIRYNMDAHYLLMNDIALTENWIPVGTYNNPFKGGFDGGNHRIMNFNIQEKNNNKVVGFFGYVEPKYSYQISQFDYINKDEKTYIKNVIFENPNVSNDGDASILIGKVIFNANNLPETAYNITNPPLCIDNIRFIDGNVISYEEDAGVIIGKIDIVTRAYIKPSLNINNIYSSTTISGKKSAGLIGYINDSYQSGSGVMLGITMKNFQNTGIIDETVFNIKYADENNYSPVIGGIYGNSKINLSNYIINSIFNDPGYMVNFTHYHGLNFIGYFDRETSKSLTYTLSNGYYVSRYSRNDFTSANKIKDSNIYSSWEDFDKYWKIENIDSITRIPVLKDIDYTYTSISDISLKKYDEVSLLSYVNQKSNYSYIDYEVISNDNIIDIKYASSNNAKSYNDIVIRALNDGTAKIHVINNYDGFEKDITINVDSDVLKLPIITYCVNNGTDEEIYTQQVSSLKTFNLIKNKFVMNGYIFDSWNTETDGKGISYQDEASFNEGISEDLRLYAQWKPIKYTLKFNSNTGVGTMNDIKLNYDESKKIPANTFTKEGYVFVGWNTKADGTGISYSDNEEVLNLSSTENDIINLYAIWEKEYATITFDANGGEGNMNKIEVKVSDDIVLTENVFTKTGYAFKGWNTKQDGTGTSYNDMQNILVQDSITLYAQWTPIKYSLFLSDGMGNNKQQELTYDKEEKIVKNEFSKKGYIFAGWNTKQDGTGTRYDDEETIHNLADTENSVIPLYAEWTPISYKIIFYANGGMGWPHEEEFIYDVEKSLPKCTFTREGYSFTGWNTELDGSGQLYSSGRKVLNLIDENDGVFELYAQWVKNDNTIVNNTKDYEGFYDEKEHSIDLNIEPSDYSIKYSINNTNYDLDELPKFKEVGEYTVNYKITKDGYEDLTGSNKVKIYGIRKLGDGISIKNDILITDNNKFVDVINNIDTYSKVTEFFHYDKDKKLVDGIVKTGDFIDVNINDSKSYLYKLSLLGDVNGDGKITSADYVKIRKHIMQTELIKDNLYFYSADVNDDNKISSADYVKIRKYIMNGESL